MLRFFQTLKARKASSWLKENIFDPLGHKNLLYLIQMNQSLIGKIPPDTFSVYMQKIPKASLNTTDEEIYSWIPSEYRKTIESCPSGKEWAFKEMKLLKEKIGS